MKRTGIGCLAVAATGIAWSPVSLAQTIVTVGDTPVTVGFNGFMRVDYGAGDRYPVADGEDRLGISKTALATSVKTEDITMILVLGGTALTDSNPDDKGQIGIKDAYLVLGGGAPEGFSYSVGAQPLLFGLKPNGYPGDSSLQPNIDYGAAGGFAVSNQAGPSLIGTYKFSADMSLRFGTFDLASSNAINGVKPATSGSRLKDNLFLLWRGNKLMGTDFYATAGAERTYVGTAAGQYVDKAKPIYSAGVGYMQGIVDASIEYIHLNAAIVNTKSDESYWRATASIQPIENWTIYGDYSTGHELGASTYRVGASWQFRKHLALTAEYSKDTYDSSNGNYAGTNAQTGAATFGSAQPKDAQSVDARLTFSF